MNKNLQSVSTTDLYYICQVVDNVTRKPGEYLRNLEDIFGDMRSMSLARNFPKWTVLHEFIEEIVCSIAFEDAVSTVKKPKDYWITHLIADNSPSGGTVYAREFGVGEGHEYFDYLNQTDIFSSVVERIAGQVFHVLFSNRRTLQAFGLMCSSYLTDTSPAFAPNSFTNSDYLKRANIPSWAKSAVYHRDKGHCVLCRTNLTNLVTQEGTLHFDHILPLKLGGMNCVTNLQLLCKKCNEKKGARNWETSDKYEVWYEI